MRRHTRSFLTCTLLAGLLLPVLAQANARLDGKAETIDELVIEWPSGERTVLLDLAVDRLHFVREGAEVALEGR